MTRTQALFAASLLLGTVAACGQASEPSDAPATPATPDAPETALEGTVVSEDLAATDIVEAESESADVTDVVAAAEDDGHDHDHGDDHTHDDDHDHDHSHDDDHSHDHDHDHSHDHDDDHRHGGEAHVHGAAEFSLVIAADGVEAEFRSPLYNLVGFEHEPQTPEQAVAITLMTGQLNSPASIFTVDADAGCAEAMGDVSIERSGDHGSATAIYTLSCSDSSAISAVTLTAFENFASLETVDIVVIGATSQEAGTTNSESPVFALGG